MEKPFSISCVLHFTRHFMCRLMVGIPFCQAFVCIFSGVAFNINHNSLLSLHIITSFQNRHTSTNVFRIFKDNSKLKMANDKIFFIEFEMKPMKMSNNLFEY